MTHASSNASPAVAGGRGSVGECPGSKNPASDCLDDLPLGDGGSQGFKVWIIEHPDVDGSAGAVGNERAACFDMARLDGDRPAG